jgi:hypothetical protein
MTNYQMNDQTSNSINTSNMFEAINGIDTSSTFEGVKPTSYTFEVVQPVNHNHIKNRVNKHVTFSNMLDSEIQSNSCAVESLP